MVLGFATLRGKSSLVSNLLPLEEQYMKHSCGRFLSFKQWLTVTFPNWDTSWYYITKLNFAVMYLYAQPMLDGLWQNKDRIQISDQQFHLRTYCCVSSHAPPFKVASRCEHLTPFSFYSSTVIGSLTKTWPIADQKRHTQTATCAGSCVNESFSALAKIWAFGGHRAHRWTA